MLGTKRNFIPFQHPGNLKTFNNKIRKKKYGAITVNFATFADV